MSGDDKSARPKLNDLLDRQIAYLESQPKWQSFETQLRLAMQMYQEVAEFARNLEARIDAAPSHEAPTGEAHEHQERNVAVPDASAASVLEPKVLRARIGLRVATAWAAFRDGRQGLGHEEAEHFKDVVGAAIFAELQSEAWQRDAAPSSIGTPDEMPTPRTHPTGWTFDRWIALQPYLSKDIGSFTVDGERYYAASTVKGAWIAGEQCVGVSATLTPDSAPAGPVEDPLDPS